MIGIQKQVWMKLCIRNVYRREFCVTLFNRLLYNADYVLDSCLKILANINLILKTTLQMEKLRQKAVTCPRARSQVVRVSSRSVLLAIVAAAFTAPPGGAGLSDWKASHSEEALSSPIKAVEDAEAIFGQFQLLPSDQSWLGFIVYFFFQIRTHTAKKPTGIPWIQSVFSVLLTPLM